MKDKKPSYFIEESVLQSGKSIHVGPYPIELLYSSLISSAVCNIKTVAIFKIYPHEKTTPTITAD